MRSIKRGHRQHYLILMWGSAVLLGCGGGAPGDGDVADDATNTRDTGATAEELAACSNLAGLPGSCLPGGTRDACAAALASRRVESAEPGCVAVYQEWVSCMTRLTECDTSGGVLCPAEYSALGMCSGADI